jgi:hypothetical protein
MKLTRSLGLALVFVVALAFAAPAVAASPGQDAYGGTGASQVTAGSLPFTGMNLVTLVVVGAVLLGTGIVIRHSVRRGAR